MLHIQKISNSTIFYDVMRTIKIVGINMNSDISCFNLYYRIGYEKDGNDVTEMFKDQVPEWTIDNSKNMMLRDESFNPILNPDFIELKDNIGNVLNENEKFKTMPAFDYVKMLMLDMNVPMKALISRYITEEDQEGRFNF